MVKIRVDNCVCVWKFELSTKKYIFLLMNLPSLWKNGDLVSVQIIQQPHSAQPTLLLSGLLQHMGH